MLYVSILTHVEVEFPVSLEQCKTWDNYLSFKIQTNMKSFVFML